MLIFAMFLFAGCYEKGKTYEQLSGFEEALPPELKGLKVYSVKISDWEGDIKVAVLDDQINSIKYTVGKFSEAVLILNSKNNKRVIEVKDIISENDSIMVIRKK